MNLVRIAQWLVLVVLVAISSTWSINHFKKIIQLDDKTLLTSIDATMTQLTLRQFNEEGQLVNLIISPLMTHIPKQNVYLFQNPQIVIHQTGQPEWTISARKAKSFNGDQEITFTENVIIHQDQSNNTSESTLKTEKIIYYPKHKKAISDLLVTFEQPGHSIQSTGMIAYLQDKRIELLHQARGSYDPAKG